MSLLLLFLAPSQGHALMFTVNTTADVTSAATITNCQTGVGQCTLRAAVQAANASIGVADTIILPAGTYLVGTGLLSVAGPAANALTITGAGAATTIIDGNNANQVFQTTAGAVLIISGVTIQHGLAAAGAAGGGLDVGGGTSVELRDAIVTANTATGVNPDGGGINNGGTLSMINVVVTGNTNAVGGAGISNGAAATMNLTNVTISGNTGRGIDSKAVGVSNLTNVTISKNNAASGAGINNTAGTLNLLNVTVNDNTAAAVNVGGIDNVGLVNIRNSIVSNNAASNCGAALASQGNNLSSDATCFVPPAAGDVLSTDPLLSPLANNGGAVPTHALRAGSPAIDTGAGTNPATFCPATDARGIARPVNGNVIPPVGAALCDKGAFEFRPQKIVVTPASLAFGIVTIGAPANQTITVSNAGDNPLVIGTIGGLNPLAAPFSFLVNNCVGALATLTPIPLPAQTCTVTVDFSPTAATASSDSFDIPSNDPAALSVAVAVAGTGSAVPVPGISVTDSIAPSDDHLLAFGNVTIGLTSDATVTVTNTGTADLVIGTIAAPAAPFSITSDGCSGKTLAASAACALTVHFAPTANSVANTTFDIPHNVTGTPPVTMTLTGSGISTTGNHAPSIPVLVSPANGQTGVPTTMTFVWNKSVDPDSDTVTYHFLNCTDTGFTTGCTNNDVTAAAPFSLYFAGIGSIGAGIILIGFVAKNGTRRARMMMLVIALLLVSGTFFVACHKSSSEPPPPAPAEQISNIVRNLTLNTTYYWKVVADDGKGGTSTSTVSSYTTAP